VVAERAEVVTEVERARQAIEQARPKGARQSQEESPQNAAAEVGSN
jgi:hypothetical protein